MHSLVLALLNLVTNCISPKKLSKQSQSNPLGEMIWLFSILSERAGSDCSSNSKGWLDRALPRAHYNPTALCNVLGNYSFATNPFPVSSLSSLEHSGTLRANVDH